MEKRVYVYPACWRSDSIEQWGKILTSQAGKFNDQGKFVDKEEQTCDTWKFECYFCTSCDKTFIQPACGPVVLP